MTNTNDLLAWLSLDLKALLALANPTNRVRPARTNYAEWSVPKRTYGVRIICAPKRRLKSIQRRIKVELLDRVALHPALHGFRIGRSIVTNAAEHVSRPLILNLDLKDFFEHIRYPRVIGVFRRIGYSLEVARWLAMLCTHQPSLGALSRLSADHPYVHRSFRHAVQGAPTSPGLANLVVHRMDCRFSGLARRFDATYSRYADDLTFSGSEPFKRGMIRFIPLLRRIVKEEGFTLNDRKMRFMRSGERQQVTGVVVNEKVNVARDEYDRLKAIIHNAQRTGLAAQNRDERPNFLAYLIGRAAHIRHLNPVRGQRLLDALADVA